MVAPGGQPPGPQTVAGKVDTAHRPLPLLSVLALAAIAIGLTVGSVPLAPAGLWDLLTGNGDPLTHSVVLDLRLPRVLAAFGIGASLALAGALMQVLLGNPLADPYVLGVSGGAAVGALLAILAGAAGLALGGGAFAGAFLSILLVFTLARGGPAAPTRLLLTGVVVAAGWGALVTFLLAAAPERDLRGMLFWLMGDLSQTTAGAPMLVLALLGLAITWPFGRALNLLARGELTAGALGVAVRPLRWHLYFTASLLTAGAVTVGGSIGFVGLIVPHLIRLHFGGDHRQLLPAVALAGGTLLVLADTLARSILAPRQLPVGSLTALIGVPLFLYLLQRTAGRVTR